MHAEMELLIEKDSQGDFKELLNGLFYGLRLPQPTNVLESEG